MNHYRKKNFSRNRNFGGRHRRPMESVNQPLPANLEMIPYSRHTMSKQDIEAVVEALLSGTLTGGEELERFESLLAKLTHCYHAVAFSSGTAAVHAALSCLDLGPGDEVITSTLNFCAVANMVKLVGATPVLIDCDADSLTISPEEVKRAMTPKTRAVFSNNFAGHAADLSALREICDENNLVLLDDACHGLGGRYRGHYIGNQADLTCFSFHPSKVVTTGEGGAVTTQNAEWAQKLKMFRHHGIRRNIADRPAYYQEQQFLGLNYRMSELHAALGRSQLARLERHVERRRTIADYYRKNLAELSDIALPPSADWVEHAYHLFPIQLKGSLAGHRDTFFKEMHAAHIGVQVHYIPVHRMPFHQQDPSHFPNAEAYYQNCISLPIFPDLSIKDLERVVEAVRAVAEKCAHLPRPNVSEVAEKKAEPEQHPHRGRSRYKGRGRGKQEHDNAADTAKKAPVVEESKPAAVAPPVVAEGEKPKKAKTTRRKTTKPKPVEKEAAKEVAASAPKAKAEPEAEAEKKPAKTTKAKTTKAKTTKAKAAPKKAAKKEEKAD
ncbi:MAG: DegT/DnrJ/EryC1/StrS aminotransferase family protein [Acidobacteria bacterium]|nr:DegT/DnrJ/EryC1/StrS aminotransferase family protein [Acidobacteriota bacterium]MCB9398086.1 DegT/DnrJ/EryC1/StrS aminotransferase family protein [Acidobacteriota bacterium]